MSIVSFSHERIVREAKLSPEDIQEIKKRRCDNNRLGFGYQLAFVRLTNRFPTRQPLEILDELLIYVSVQIDNPTDVIELYKQRRQTIAEHGTAILAYLNLRPFGEAEIKMLEEFLFEEVYRLEQTGSLLVLAKHFLKEASILFPADDTLQRLIIKQRQIAKEHILARIFTDIILENPMTIFWTKYNTILAFVNRM